MSNQQKAEAKGVCMSSREEFEEVFPVPLILEWDKGRGVYRSIERGVEHLAMERNSMLRAWQAATSRQQERIRELEEALQAIVDPIYYIRTEAEKEDCKLNGAVAIALSQSAEFLKSIARKALSATAQEKQE